MYGFLLVVNPSEDFVVDDLVQLIQYFSHNCHQFFHFVSLFSEWLCGNIARNLAGHNFFHRKCSHHTTKHNFAGILLFCVHPTGACCRPPEHQNIMGLDFVLGLRTKFGGCLTICSEGTTFYSLLVPYNYSANHMSFLCK